MTESLKTTLRYYGISPWEIEVLYGFLNSHFTIIQDEIEQNYNIQLLYTIDRKREKLYFKHNVEGLLRADSKSRGEFLKAMFGVGGLSINQILEKEDMDPIEDELADEHFIPINMVPLRMVEKYFSQRNKEGAKDDNGQEDDGKANIKQKGDRKQKH